MPVSERTIKTLFAKSHNRCAIPECMARLVVGDTVLGEICHIRARRKGGRRYDPALSEPQKNAAANLILLCPTCHTLVDKDKTDAWSVEYLSGIKERHERDGAVELTPELSRDALAILAHHKALPKRSITSSAAGASTATASRGGIAVSIAGHNQGPINIRSGGGSGPRPYPPNSIGADANLTGYIEYLLDLYVEYSAKFQDEATARGKLGRQIKTKFRIGGKRTRYHVSVERFHELVEFIIGKLWDTPVGNRHRRNGTKICSSFSEWRTTTR